MASHDASAALGALKATLVGGMPPDEGARALPSVSATMRVDSDNGPPGVLDLDETMGAAEGAALTVTPAGAATTAVRTTVSPAAQQGG